MDSSTLSPAVLEDYFAFLRFPTVSAQCQHRPDMLACAEWLRAKLAGAGLTAGICPTPGHPVVLAHNEKKAGRPTVLIYGHYDVQPPEPLELWNSPPFEPTVKDGIVTARGSTDNKGQILAHILGVEEILKRGAELPVNVIFLIEGEEEIGSPNLAPFLQANRERLACDGVVISDTGMVGPGVPTLTYALRGISCLEVVLRGPSVDLHSGVYGGAVDNPARVLASILAKLHDADGRVTVPGFYDAVDPLEAWEREAWAKLPFGDEALRKLTGAPKLRAEAGYTPIEAIWGRPTLEINGLTSGYQGEGSKTVLPAEARAKISCRLVPRQDPGVIFKQVSAWLKELCPSTVTMTIEEQHGGEPYLTSPQSGWGPAAIRALAKAWGRADVATMREGGSIPIVADFRRILGADTYLLGLALPDCAAHSPNETFPLENLAAGIRLNQALLHEIVKG
jgi:acetylornithine deacetylase/succinyl-diaminopimelate desuccinylase-like protein